MRNISGLKTYEPLVVRFNKSYKVSENGCWEWQGSLTNKGYGRIRNGSKNKVAAHRISYMLYIGTLENNLNVLHKCDNPKCVNPMHLFKGTQSDNVIDMYNKGRGRWK